MNTKHHAHVQQREQMGRYTYTIQHYSYVYPEVPALFTVPCYIHYFQLNTQLRTYAALAQARPTMSCILLVIHEPRQRVLVT